MGSSIALCHCSPTYKLLSCEGPYWGKEEKEETKFYKKKTKKGEMGRIYKCTRETGKRRIIDVHH